MRAIVAAGVAVVVAMVSGALATRASAASALIGMAPVNAGLTDKNSAAALKQLLLETKSGVGARIGPHLYNLQKAYGAQPLWHDGALRAKLPPLRVQDGYVRISAYGDNVSELKTQLVGQGMLEARLHDHAVTGRVPVAALSDLASIAGLKFVKPVLATTRVGLTTTQGDHSMRSDLARSQFGVDGTGVRVGVLSDSFDCAPGPFASGQNFTRAGQDAVNGDLPLGVRVLSDLHTVPDSECTDEGRAMMQIVHDVAPGTSLSFNTAVTGEEDFAAGILALANDGAKVIVDDVEYFDEPMFEDGVVADAVDQAVARGVAYFSAAGNEGRQSYQAAFRASGRKGLAGVRHNFDPGPGVSDLQHVVAPPGTISLLSLQWDQPSFSSNGSRGSQSDVDAIFYNMDGTPVAPCTDSPAQLVCQEPGIANNIGGDAVELPVIVNLSNQELQVQLGIELVSGPTPGVIKYVWYDLGSAALDVDTFDTAASTIVGHANAAGAEAVGAAAWYQTQAWGSPLRPQCVPACLDSFSSAGGTPILFDRAGRRLDSVQWRAKPGVTGPDAGNTSFFYFKLGFNVPGSSEDDAFPNFSGTSAAAAHVVGVAALILDKRARDIAAHRHVPTPRVLTPAALYNVLQSTASDMRLRNLGGNLGPQPVNPVAGFDYDAGFGLVDAVAALQAIGAD
ncbi:MAG TPA: S8 family serine peptidase [Steroidobacteraceae bacterium]|nr:S8 family serine peptidase [Steroidobacteraceae bacterium]